MNESMKTALPQANLISHAVSESIDLDSFQQHPPIGEQATPGLNGRLDGLLSWKAIFLI
jgi:hypothetical protein